MRTQRARDVVTSATGALAGTKLTHRQLRNRRGTCGRIQRNNHATGTGGKTHQEALNRAATAIVTEACRVHRTQYRGGAIAGVEGHSRRVHVLSRGGCLTADPGSRGARMDHARVAAQGAGGVRGVLEVQGVVSGAGGAFSNGNRNVQVVQIALGRSLSSVIVGRL